MCIRKHTATAALAAVLLVLSACGTPTVAINEDLAELKRPISLRLLWRHNVGGMSDWLRASQSDEIICTVSRSGTIMLTSLDGEDAYPPISLPRDTFGAFSAGASCRNNIVAAVRGDGVLYVYDFSGNLLWVQNMKTRILGAPLLTDRHLFVSGLDGRLLAYPIRRNTEIWRYISPLQNLMRTPVDSMPTEDKGIIYAGIDNGALVALRASDGRVVWENTVAFPGGDNVVTNILDVTTPVVKDGIVCAGAYQGGIACFKADDGKLLWSESMSVAKRAVFDDSGARIFVSDLDGMLYAFDAQTGETLWEVQTESPLTSPAYVPGAVIVGDEAGTIHAYLPESGKLIVSLPILPNRILHLFPLNGIHSDLIGLSANGVLFRARFEF